MTTNVLSREVLVGIDGSQGSRLALEWALDKQDVLGPVRTIGTYLVTYPVDITGLAPAHLYDPSLYLDAARARVEGVLDATDPSLKADNTMVEGSAGRSLVDASKGAGLLVVGCRGRSPATEMLLGSVGSYCVKHATCPVAIIPDQAEVKGPLERLVVGIDGSATSRAALRWALDHVAENGSVVAMMTFPMMLHAFAVPDQPQQVLEAQARKVLEETVDAVATAEERETLLELDVHVGDPRNELAAALGEADALVIGSRGHRGVAHLLLGSVTTSLTHQPAGVTIVVPDPDR